MKNYFQNKITVVYDVYDRYSEYGNEYYDKNQNEIQDFDNQELQVIKQSDLVLCASETLFDECKKISTCAIKFPNAIPEDFIINDIIPIK